MKERFAIFNKDCTQDGTWFSVVPKEIRTLSFDEFKEELTTTMKFMIQKQKIKTTAIKDALNMYDEFSDKTIVRQDVIDRLKALHPEASTPNTFILSASVLDVMYKIPTYVGKMVYSPDNIRTKSYLEVSNKTMTSMLESLESTRALIESFVEEDVKSEKWKYLQDSCTTHLALHITKVY